MWHDLFSVQIPILEKLLRTIAVYALLVVIFRMTGKRTISSMNTMDFVVLFLLSNVVQNAIIGDDSSFAGGAIGAITLIVVNDVVDRLAYRYPRVRRLVEGSAADVIVDGKPQRKVLRRLGIRIADLDHAVRLQNGDAIHEVERAVLEPGGQLVVNLKPAEQSASVGDVADLTARLARIEALLVARSGMTTEGA